MFVQTQITPNPNSLKFLPGRRVSNSGTFEINDKNKTSNENIMPKKGAKRYKTTMNLLRTIGPIEFEICPKNSKNGDGFILHPFDIIDENTVRLNFMFEVLFFLPLYIVKQVFNGPINNTPTSI